MAKTVYTKDELNDLMAEAVGAVEQLVKSEVAALQKNAPPPGAPKGAPAMKSDSVQTAEDKKAQGGTPFAKAGEDPSGPPPDASASAPAASPGPSPDAAASPAPDAAAGDPAGAGAPSMEELVSAYSQLSPDELQIHMQALQQVVQQAAAGGAPPGAAPASPSPSPAAPAPGPDATAPMPGDQSQGVNPEFAMKHEKVLAEVADLKKSLGFAVDALALVIGQPKVKSIQAEDVVLKNEPSFEVQKLSKGEIVERLNKAIRAGKLEKSDGELVKGFYNGQKQVADIAHLLK